MNHSHNRYTNNQLYPGQSPEKNSINNPLKSPSPDKKRSNIITPTRSPELIDIKRNMTPSRIRDKRPQHSVFELKPYDQSTRYYTKNDFQEYRSSQRKNQTLDFLQNVIPQQFVLNNSEIRYTGLKHPSSNELDYIKLLQQKQRTIRELHEIIEMINKNNSLDLSNSDLFGNITASRNKRGLDSSHKTVFTYKQNDLSGQKQFKNQIRILTIENQQLIHMIQKLKDQQKQAVDFQKNMQKDHLDFSVYKRKQEILSRQIYEMKGSLLHKDQENSSLLKENQQIYAKYIQLDQQNQKLIKMMKDKQLSDRKYHSSLIQSNISQKSSISESQTREKLTLVKIKDQYNQNLKVFKDTVYQDLDQFMRQIELHIKDLEQKLLEMGSQVQSLQKFKAVYNQLIKKSEWSGRSQISYPQQSERRRQELQDLSVIQISQPERQRYRQIESLLMQKNQNYEKQLTSERQNNREIQTQLKNLIQKHKQLQTRYSKLLEESDAETLKVKISMTGSRRKNMEQIQDINSAKAQDVQLQKLRQLIRSYQQDFNSKKQTFLSQIQSLKSKNISYQQIIEAQSKEYQDKQSNIQDKPTEKSFRRTSSKIQGQIEHYNETLSEKQLSDIPGQDPLAEVQIQNLKSTILEKQEQSQQRQLELNEYIRELRQKVKEAEQSQEKRKVQIEQLVQNYHKQINILKAALANYEVKHVGEVNQLTRQIEELTNEINVLIQQAATHEKILQNSQDIHRQQTISFQTKVSQLERELNNRNRESRELLHSKEVLLTQQSQMKQNLQELLQITRQVQQLQNQSTHYKEQIARMDQHIKNLKLTIQSQNSTIAQKQELVETLKLKVRQMNDQIRLLHCQIERYNLLKMQHRQLEQKSIRVRKQSQEQINQKDIQFTIELQKFQEEKAEYEFLVKQLKEQHFHLNQQINSLRDDNIKQQDNYNYLLCVKQDSLLQQLYQLRSIVSKNMSGMFRSELSMGEKSYNYDIGKLFIQFEVKIQENKLLHSTNDDLREEVKTTLEERHLLEEKISFLEKNIAIYEAELKQRKIFCEKLITDKSKIEKELLLTKKLKFQAKNQEQDRLRQSLVERVNNLVKIQEGRQREFKEIVQRRHQSPIKRFSTLISKVEQFSTFTPKQTIKQVLSSNKQNDRQVE